MDGYIKNKQQALRSVRRGMIGKYSVAAVPLILLCVLVLFVQFVAHQNPKRWKEETVTFAGFGEMWLLLDRDMSDALITEDGRRFYTGSTEQLQNALIVGEEYSIVYSSNLTGKHLEGLSKNGIIYIDVQKTAQAWREDARQVLKLDLERFLDSLMRPLSLAAITNDLQAYLEELQRFPFILEVSLLAS